jgi:ribosomal protein S18 acetylase RimI-like enzyme
MKWNGSASVARRIEHAEATMIGEFGRLAARQFGDQKVFIGNCAGGIAVAAGPGAPYSKVAGLGFEPIDESALAVVESAYAERATPVRVELSSLGSPEAGTLLTRRGYMLQGFENVLAISLPAPHREIAGAAVALAAETETAQWIDVLASSFAAPDTYDGPIVEEHVDRGAIDALLEQTSEIDGFMAYLARRNGEVAGAGGMRIANGIAQLCGAGTLPAHRRRGVQTALLQQRLADAARAGCDIAVVTTQPGSVSQQNVQRQGFELLYARAILVKAGSGGQG